MAIVATSSSSGAVPGANQSAIIHFPSNGIDLLLYTDAGNIMCRHSTDGGTTWATPVSGATAYTGSAGGFSAKLDASGNIQIAFTQAQAVWHLRGQPGAGNITFTWSAATKLTTGSQPEFHFYAPDIFPEKFGSNILLHLLYVYWENVAESTDIRFSRVHYARWTIPDSGGTPTSVAGIVVETADNPLDTVESPGAITVDAAHDVHMAYGWAPNWKYARLPYGDGTWPSIGLIKEVVMPGASTGVAQIVLSPLNAPCIAAQTGTTVGVASKASGAWVNISPGATGTHPQGFFEGSTYQLCYVSSGLKMRRHTSGTWSTEITVNPDTGISRLSVERKPTGRTIGAASLTGAAAPFTVTYNRIPLPAQGYNMII